MTGLRARRPTGSVAWPLILLEGEEKSGKTCAALELSASPRVGRTFAFDLDEGAIDEYAELGPYEVVDHAGTYSDLVAQLEAATKVPPVDGNPNVIVLDSGSALWSMLSAWADERARRSEKARRILRADPDAEVRVPMNLWTDAKGRWGRVVNLLRYWPGIAIVIARGREVAKVGPDGNPVAGETEWKVEVERSFPFNASAWVRMTRPRTARLIAARSLRVEVPADGLALDGPRPLERLVFEVLGAGGKFEASRAVRPDTGWPVPAAKARLVEVLGRSITDEARVKAEALAVWNAVGLGGLGPGDELSAGQRDALAQAAADRIAELAQAEDTGTEAPPIDQGPGLLAGYDPIEEGAA